MKNEKMKELNHATNFNPYDALKQSLKEDGLPAYTEYIVNGQPVLTDDKRFIMVPRVHLDSNAYRDWWQKEYPEGRIEVIRLTKDPYLKEDGTFAYPQEVFEVRFYLHKDDPLPKASGFGKADYKENGEFDEIGTAISKAFSNGMRNMGFGVDLDQEEILNSLPKYIDIKQVGKTAEYVPLTPSKKATAKEAATHTPEAQKTTGRRTSKQAEAKTETAIEGDAIPISAPVSPTPEITQPLADAPKNISDNTDGAYIDNPVIAFMQNANNAQGIPSVGLEDIMSKDEKSESSHANPEHTVPTHPEEALPAEVLTDPVAAENPASDGADELTAAEAVIFTVLDPADKLKEYAGMTMGELNKQQPAIINMLCRKQFRWEGRISEECHNAALIIRNW